MQLAQGYIRYDSQVIQPSLPDFHHGEGQICYLDLFPNPNPSGEIMRTRTTTIFPFQFSDYNETVEFWHNTCFGIGRKNILQLIGLAISNEDSKSVLIHTERVNRSIFEWAEREQSLLNQHIHNPSNPANSSNPANPANQHTCALLTANHLLPSAAFGQVMRGILEGINQASSLNADADNINSKSTFLVAGVAKVSLLIKKGKFGHQRHPLRQFTKMISELSQTAPLHSSELYWFLYFIDTNSQDREFCEELPTHPSLYEMSTRLQFRCQVSKHLSALRALNLMEYKKIETTFRTLEMKIITYKNTYEPHCSNGPHHQFYWKTHINGFKQNCPYRNALTPAPPAAFTPAPPAKRARTCTRAASTSTSTRVPVANYPVANYSKDPLDFVRYCRNMAQHPGKLKEQDLESKFTNIWKEYIPCLHEALRIHKQLPKIYDKKDSI